LFPELIRVPEDRLAKRGEIDPSRKRRGSAGVVERELVAISGTRVLSRSKRRALRVIA